MEENLPACGSVWRKEGGEQGRRVGAEASKRDACVGLERANGVVC